MTRFLMFLCVMTISSLTVEAKKIKKVGDSSYEDKFTFVQERHLYSGDDGLTVVNLDLEWPDVLNHSTSPGLQKYLCKALFDNEGTSMTEGLEMFLRPKGTEISQMPDNADKVNHISIELLGVLWEKYKYISFRYKVLERDSSSPKDSINYGFFTYDMLNDKILTAHDIIRARFFPGSFEHGTMIDYVVSRMNNTEEFREEDIPGEVFLMPGGVALAMEDVSRKDGYISLVSLPLDDYSLNYLLLENARKLLKSEPEVRLAPSNVKDIGDEDAPPPGTDPNYIYKVVEEKPDLAHEGLSIDTYLTKNAKYPLYEEFTNISGKVVLQFVVEVDGKLSNITSIRPISPGLAREAVRVLRDTPKWKPATINGIPVRSLCTVTVNFAIK